MKKLILISTLLVFSTGSFAQDKYCWVSGDNFHDIKVAVKKDCKEGDLLWDMAVRPIRINVFDQIGQYVTGFDIPEVLIDDDRYLDEKGNVTLRVEMPIPNGSMESVNGVSTATGVYLLSTAIATEAIPSACNSVGRKRQTSRSILTPVGYTR